MKIIIHEPYTTEFEYSESDFDSWDFIASGEASLRPGCDYDCGFELGRSKAGNIYGLKVLEYGSGDEFDIDEEEEDAGPYEELAAVMIDPPTNDESWIARRLMKAYKDGGGKFIEYIDVQGEFDLGRLYADNDEPD